MVIDGGDGSHKYASELELSMGKESGSKVKNGKPSWSIKRPKCWTL